MFKNTLKSDNQTKKLKLSPKTLAKTSLSMLCFCLATTASASTYILHIVEKGESLTSISKEFNVPINDIKARNNLKSDTIQLGEKVLIPVKKEDITQVLSNKKAVVTPKTTVKISNNITTKKYRVRFDDTLSRIAKKHNTTLNNLLKINNMKLSDTLLAGKFILVPTTAASTTKVTTKKSTVTAKKFKPSPLKMNKAGQLIYTVQKGDTFQGVAGKMKMTAGKLQTLNKIDDVNNLMVGQKIIVRDKVKIVKNKVNTSKSKVSKRVNMVKNKPTAIKTVVSTAKTTPVKKISFSAKKATATPKVEVKTETKAKPKYITYTVQNGDTVAGVAKYFGVEKEDLIKFNKLDKSEYIKVGSTIIIAEKK